ncbi:MAG: leucyl aminopeptidase family protein [Alphaproteobacteria bacterium]|jgi:leucyl aminopeptidase|nr:leucyl aminopeptidase family protein [Alphaproteobacteria bacterium]
MTASFKTKADSKTIPVTPIEHAVFDAWLKKEPAAIQAWVKSSGFTAKPGQISLVAGKDGKLSRVLFGVKDHDGFWDYAPLPTALPEGSYRIDARMSAAGATAAATGWALGGYRFERYKSTKSKKLPTLVWPARADKARANAMAESISLVRDLINTPAEDMGPSQLAAAARTLGRGHKADVKVITGDALLKQNYPTIHAVGRASDDPPRLIDLRWGRKSDPKVTLVGKGVCFDTGGLDLKSAGGMLRMKKDMGGGAHALGLAHLIMALKLRVRLRVLVPAVENNVAGNAFRPLDVITTRKGVTVEIGNTDAEGRLVLCDALAEADSENPDMILDFATLTGAARVALGTDLPALFCNNDNLAGDLAKAGDTVNDPMWRLPLWRPYRQLLESKVADINNVSEGGFGGAITAALYLQEFVRDTTPWAHFDMMAWNLSGRPGRPAGGEAQSLRGVFEMLEKRYG